MENIVRRILNYPHGKYTNEKRNEILADVIALSLYVLSKKGYNFPDDCAELVFDKISEGADAEFDYLRKQLVVEKKFFQYEDSLYEDLPLLAHEVCHLAQSYDKNRVDNFNKAYVDPIEPENLNTVLNIFNKKNKIFSQDEFKAIKDYNLSFYYLQADEFEAYCFMIEIMNVIMNIAKSMRLTPKEQETLNTISSENLSIPLSKKFMEFKRLRHSREMAKKSEMLTNAFLTDYFKTNPNAFDSFKLKKENQTASDMLCWLVPALIVNYDDKLAHKYFNVLVNSPQKIEQEVVFLVQKTKIQLTPEEVKHFLPFIDRYNKRYNSTLTYEIIMSEKSRFQNENSRLSGENVM